MLGLKGIQQFLVDAPKAAVAHAHNVVAHLSGGHHLLHQRDGRLGTFSLPATPALLALGRQLFGEEPMLILQRHRAHHLWPALRVRDLPELPPGFELPPGPPDAALRAMRRRMADRQAAAQNAV